MGEPLQRRPLRALPDAGRSRSQLLAIWLCSAPQLLVSQGRPAPKAAAKTAAKAEAKGKKAKGRPKLGGRAKATKPPPSVPR